jgi:hypothetical protein
MDSTGPSYRQVTDATLKKQPSHQSELQMELILML